MIENSPEAAAVAESEPSASSGAGRRVEKSQSAFRTISEAATELGVAQHVLRFWESRFPQIRPLKRGGGRRYYRPEDMALLRRIRVFLYDKGYTIRGVQKLLKGNGRRDASDTTAESVSAVTLESEPTVRPARDNCQHTELRAVLAEIEEMRRLLRGRM
ncbi:MAG: MerR family transcriptional regulator [Rhodospirillales bacterium]|nr:MerR family transcriptional regulator [Rhodospirillales bacterium]